MASQSSQTVGTYGNRKDADYAVKALVTMAGLDQEQVTVDPAEGEAAQYQVNVAGSPETVDQAKNFLGAPAQPTEADEEKSPYGLKHARDLMAFDDFG
jgi:hypothetical protein